MMNLENFSTDQMNHKRPEFVLKEHSRYFRQNTYDLSSQKKEENNNDDISITKYRLSKKDQILLSRGDLLKKRAQVFDCWFLRFRKSKQAEIKRIDEQIDLFEEQLILIERGERENLMTNTRKLQAEVDALLYRLKG